MSDHGRKPHEDEDTEDLMHSMLPHGLNQELTTPIVGSVDWFRTKRFFWLCVVAICNAVLIGYLYQKLIAPFCIAAFLTYLLLPVVKKMAAYRVPRWLAAVSLIALALSVIAFAVIKISPVLYTQALLVIKRIPEAASNVVNAWLPSIEGYVVDLGLMKAEEIHSYLVNFNFVDQLQEQLQSGLIGLWATGSAVLGCVLNMVLVPLIMFFLLKDHEELKETIRSSIPLDLKEPAVVLGRQINATLRSVIKGQVTVALILSVLYVIGLSIVGLPSAIAIGLISGLCRVIPYLDVIVGTILSGIVIASDWHGWGQIIGVATVFLVVQGLDGVVITPRVIGERVGLHPLIPILSIIAFSDWLGFWGVLLAIPVIAILKTIIVNAWPFYRASTAYAGADPSTRIIRPPSE